MHWQSKYSWDIYHFKGAVSQKKMDKTIQEECLGDNPLKPCTQENQSDEPITWKWKQIVTSQDIILSLIPKLIKDHAAKPQKFR